jgi:hypothetical protein
VLHQVVARTVSYEKSKEQFKNLFVTIVLCNRSRERPTEKCTCNDLGLTGTIPTLFEEVIRIETLHTLECVDGLVSVIGNENKI